MKSYSFKCNSFVMVLLFNVYKINIIKNFVCAEVATGNTAVRANSHCNQWNLLQSN